MTEVHINALDAMLNYIASAANLKLCVCQTEPSTLVDCTSVSGSGGKRITIETTITSEIVVAEGANAQSRKLTIPAKIKTNGALLAVDAGTADLWLAVYDDSELLLKTDAITNEEVVNGATVTTPPFEYEAAQ